MKKLVLVLLAVAAALPALAQRRDRRDDRRDFGRVECTIYTNTRGSAFGSGRDCYEAIDMAYNRCLNIVSSDKGRRRCANAGRFRTSEYEVRCENRRAPVGGPACRHILPYSY